MKVATRREKLQDYLRFADDKKVEAIYTLVKEEIESKKNHWDDPVFLEELEQRAKAYENGKTKPNTWEEVKAKVRQK